MSESTLWTWLKRARDHYGRRLDIRRMENSISTGDADTDGVLNGDDFAMELKACKRPARATSKLQHHEVTQAQVDWHSNRLDAGGASCFLIQVGEDRFIVHGRHGVALRDGVTLGWLDTHGTLVATPWEAVMVATMQRDA